MKMRDILALGAPFAATACATTPDVTVRYYQPKVTLQTTVVATLTCDMLDRVMMATTVIAKPTYTADKGVKPVEIKLKAFDGSFANSDVGFTFYEDGRLSGVNVSESGQGSEMVKSAIVLAGAVGAALASADPATIKNECDLVRNSKDKIVTLTFGDTENFVPGPKPDHPEMMTIDRIKKPVTVSPDSADLLAQVAHLPGDFCLTAKAQPLPPKRVEYTDDDKDMVDVPLIQPAVVSLEVEKSVNAHCDTPIWTSELIVPQGGTPLIIKVPKAPVFGKQSFALGLAESGQITSIKYGRDSGISPAMDAASSVLGAISPTNSVQAADLKAQADVIAQQQRLIRCKADPKSCV